jgi:hypothetical protein
MPRMPTTLLTISDDAELTALIKVREGFSVFVAGRDLGNTRMLAIHGDHLYATRRTEGDLIRLGDADGHVLAKGEIVGLFDRPVQERPANEFSSFFVVQPKDYINALDFTRLDDACRSHAYAWSPCPGDPVAGRSGRGHQ